MIILFNGPPGAGKDTAARVITESGLFNYFRDEKFARSVKEGCHGLFGITNEFGLVAPHYTYEGRKHEKLAEFMGMTPREAYIWYSEEVMKPKFGLPVFGELTLQRIKQTGWDNWMITDSGFDYEARPLVEHFGVRNVVLVRLHREGHTFEGDSRSYIELPGVRTWDLANDGTEHDLENDLVWLFENWKIPYGKEVAG